LLTPYGLKLCSPVKYDGLMAERGGSGEYFLGDRENGGVFKHADMMAAVAMLKAAKEVADRSLAADLADLAYRVIDVVLPYRTMRDPYVLAGNPRFCTQYNNSDTGENVGPTVSGTATWLWLALKTAYGIAVSPEGIEIDPLLREDQEECTLVLNTGSATYQVRISKPKGFQRTRDKAPRVSVDGVPWPTNRIPHFADGAVHMVELRFGLPTELVEPVGVPAEFDAPGHFR
jgi:cellobiose phosphorylase